MDKMDEFELDLTQDEYEILERLAIMASDLNIKIVCYVKSGRVVVKEA
jgi:hypothetical protein